MPPFGNLFGLPVVVDQALEKDELIYFNAGNHVQTVRLLYRDFAKLVKPRVVRLVKRTKGERRESPEETESCLSKFHTVIKRGES